MNQAEFYRFIIIASTGLLLLTTSSLSLNPGESIVLRADSFDKDNHWDKFAWCFEGGNSNPVGNCWCVHRNWDYGTVGEAWTDFPGPNGKYRIQVKLQHKYNGSSPYGIKVNGQQIHSANTPRCQPAEPYNDYCRYVNVKDNYQLDQGDEIRYWGEVTRGSKGGVYACWVDMKFTLREATGQTSAPALELSSSHIKFEAIAGQNDPAPKTVRVSNSGDGTLPDLRVEEDVHWLEINVEGSGNSQELVNRVALNNLNPGTHSARVNVEGQGIQQVSYEVEVELEQSVLISRTSSLLLENRFTGARRIVDLQGREIQNVISPNRSNAQGIYFIVDNTKTVKTCHRIMIQVYK